MDNGNVALMRELFASWNRGDRAATADALDEFVVWDARQSAVPDLQGVYQGLAGVAEFWARWLPMWESVTSEILWAGGVGDRVLMWIHQIHVGRGSGAEVPVDYGWDVSFRDGKIIRVTFFDDEEGGRKLLALR